MELDLNQIGGINCLQALDNSGDHFDINHLSGVPAISSGQSLSTSPASDFNGKLGL